MSPADSSDCVVFVSKQRRDCTERRLVLEAMGIPSTIGQGKGGWQIEVDESDEGRAFEQLAAYQVERSGDVTPVAAPIPTFDGAGWGVIVYALFLGSIALLSQVNAYHFDWYDVGRMRAGEVVAGQWTQVVTALTLHADLGHLLSNLLFGSLFGYLAGRVLGGGVAWLTILLAGALGNLLNALARSADHTSIGASTAVFAALGILVAHALHPRKSSIDPPLKRFSPLIAGTVMLAFLGTEGERTDVLAHVTGFFAGVIVGWIGCRIPRAWLASSATQWIAATTACATLIGCWIIAQS